MSKSGDTQPCRENAVRLLASSFGKPPLAGCLFLITSSITHDG